MPTTQSNTRILETSLSGKKRPENLTTGGIAHVLVDRVVFEGGETTGAVVELSNSIPLGSIVDLAASSINNASMSGVSAKVSTLAADGATAVDLFPSASIATAGAKVFNANGGLVTMANSSLKLTLTAGTAGAAAVVQVRIAYYVR